MFLIVFPYVMFFSHKVFTEAYDDKLSTPTELNVIGKIWTVSYNVEDGSLSTLSEMLKYFRVVSNEAAVFKFDGSRVLSLRIYQIDGKRN